jgi:DNA-binding XRE family transcriptional regulator
MSNNYRRRESTFDLMLNRFMVNGVKIDSARGGSVSPAQIRAARALLNLEQETLAESAGVSRQTLISIEAAARDQLDPRRQKSMEKIKLALEANYGIEFLGEAGTKGEGVRLKFKAKR